MMCSDFGLEVPFCVCFLIRQSWCGVTRASFFCSLHLPTLSLFSYILSCIFIITKEKCSLLKYRTDLKSLGPLGGNIFQFLNNSV